MRLRLGFLLVSLVVLAGCSEARSRGQECSEEVAPEPPSTAPPSASLDGAGALSGDGQVTGLPRPVATSCDGAAAGERAGMSASDGRASAGAPAAASGGSAPDGSGNGSVQAGVLTAGVWDDNRNFDRFLAYRAEVAKAQPAGLLPIPEGEHRAAHDAVAQPGPKQKLDVSLVIDTTGSMGDEIAYLQKEFDALASTIQAKFPSADQRWSLVVYKDTTDEYVVRWFDFRADAGDFRSKLAAQSAGGGGDFPEAADQALEAATRLGWRADASVAKLLFWVADAPHHAGTEARLAGALRRAQSSGIHVYPVASSGVDELTELTMRSSAQLTGGRYVFLTDDSGVGGAHKEASVPCYFVTKLDTAILRMVDIEMTGAYREPAAAEVLRTGGDPSSGVCTLDGGEQVVVY